MRQRARSSAAAAPKYSKQAHFSDISNHHGWPGPDAQKNNEKLSMTQSRKKGPLHSEHELFVKTVKPDSPFEDSPSCQVHLYPSSCWISKDWGFSEAAGMGSVWKRLNRINKRAAKFHFTASYSELWLEVTQTSSIRHLVHLRRHFIHPLITCNALQTFQCKGWM